MKDETMKRVLKIMPMLSSSNDGEILNAVAAIRKALKSENKDIHDLCVLLSQNTNNNFQGNNNGFYDFRTAKAKTNNANELHKQQIKKILISDLILSKWETDFLESISEQMEEGRTLSKKQADCLKKIYDKHDKEQEHEF